MGALRRAPGGAGFAAEGAEIREGGQPCSHRATEHTARRSRNQRSRATKNTRSHKGHRGTAGLWDSDPGKVAAFFPIPFSCPSYYYLATSSFLCTFFDLIHFRDCS